MSGTPRKPRSSQDIGEIGRLKAQIEILQGELEECQRSYHSVSNRAQGSIPVQEVHTLLDRLGAPRRHDGKDLFIRQRFQWVHEALHGRKDG